MKTIYVMQSKTKIFFYILLLSAIMFASIYVHSLDVHTSPSSNSGNGTILYWLFIITCGVCIFLFMRIFLNPKPIMEINNQGILITRLRIGLIHWRDITNAYIISQKGMKVINLVLRNPNHYIAQLSPIKQSYASLYNINGCTPFSLGFAGTTSDPEKILILIKGIIASKKPDIQEEHLASD